MAPNDQHSATITFDTGVALGSVLSPILFLIFINALARMLTAVGQAEGIAHGVKGVEMFNCLCSAMTCRYLLKMPRAYNA